MLKVVERVRLRPNAASGGLRRVLPLLCAAALVVQVTATGHGAALAAPSEGFAHSAFQTIWQRDDGPVASGRVKRTWLWGPGPFYTDYEPVETLSEGNHLVQYFDKGRLEINDPAADPRSPWFVTSGLLVKEMVTGAAETGARALPYSIGPATVPVAGDNSAQSPTYADFATHLRRQPVRTGQIALDFLRPGGAVSPGASPVDPPVRLARYQDESGHNWASVFHEFAISPSRPAAFDSLYMLGLPITDPYWVRVPVRGVEQPVLVQLFERRTLTYTPANAPETRVEMGNVGRHYFAWRYAKRQRAQMEAAYDAVVTIGPAPQRKVKLIQSVAFTNGTGTHLASAVLRVVWNHWKGVFSLKEIKVNGKETVSQWQHGINLWLALPAPLAPGERATIRLEADLTPRPVGGRTGYDRATDILTLGDMLPTLVPFENGGWQYYPYSELGDLGNNPTSEYSVLVQSASAERLVVGGTGNLLERKADRSAWKFRADGVRDVAYVVSPRFVDPWDDPTMTRQAGKVKLLGLFLQANRDAGRRQLELCAPALDWFSRTIGEYPFTTFTVAEMGAPKERTDNYAQEYPMAYFIPGPWLALDTSPGRWTWYTPVHEVAHQWLYSTIGNNQLTDPWLDEAMATYLTAEYVRSNFPQSYGASWAGMTGNATRARPVSAGVFSGFTDESQYTAAIYDNGALMLDRIRQRMGDGPFYAAIRDYYSAYKLKRAAPADLLAIFREHSPRDLSDIFADYLGY